MKQLFGSTQNTRPILKNSDRFFRSDVPINITETEIQYLLDRNITVIVDLREPSEQTAKPCPLQKDSRFCYYSLPVTGGNKLPDCPAAVADSYLSMVDDKMAEIISLLLKASANTLFFCNAGKDRTGVVSALLLRILGYSDQEIIDDYMLSSINLKPMLDAYARAHPEIDVEIITPHREYMQRFLDTVDFHLPELL